MADSTVSGDVAGAVPVIGSILKTVATLFGRAHAAAVANEANALNQAVPPYVQGIQGIFQAVNAGQVDLQTAQTYIDQLVSQYYAAISPIMKKGGPCVFDQPMPSLCNGPCSVGCSYIERVSYLGKELLASGQVGQVTIQGLGPHAGFQGAPTLTLQLTASALQRTILTGSTVGVPLPAGDIQATTQPLTPIAGMINIGGMQIPRSTAVLLGGGLAVIFVLALIGGSGSSSQPQVVVVPSAG